MLKSTGERHGTNNDLSIGKLRAGETYAPGLEYNRPWIEGPYMTKYKGKYYLQYAATGTEYEIYADGVYVSDKPLGPFTYCPNNPFSAKTNGFYNGAGHGSTLQDVYGNWWHATTMVGGTTETARKTGLFPLGFDEDGIMYCNITTPIIHTLCLTGLQIRTVSLPVGCFSPITNL